MKTSETIYNRVILQKLCNALFVTDDNDVCNSLVVFSLPILYSLIDDLKPLVLFSISILYSLTNDLKP